MSKEFSEFIQKETERRNISQRELSKQANLSIKAVHYIINNPGSKPNVETCSKLARALDLPEALLLELAGYTNVANVISLEKQVTALAIYLNSLPERVRGYTLDACWAITRIMANALEEIDG
jgi:transcriptional regulator with XRE-family HTH domain